MFFTAIKDRIERVALSVLYGSNPQTLIARFMGKEIQAEFKPGYDMVSRYGWMCFAFFGETSYAKSLGFLYQSNMMPQTPRLWEHTISHCSFLSSRKSLRHYVMHMENVNSFM